MNLICKLESDFLFFLDVNPVRFQAQEPKQLQPGTHIYLVKMVKQLPVKAHWDSANGAFNILLEKMLN